MSGSKKRGKATPGEHRSTQSSPVNKRTSESVEKEDLLMMCSCGSVQPSKEEIRKEDSVEGGGAITEKERVSGSNEKAATQQQEKLQDSSGENSFDESVEAATAENIIGTSMEEEGINDSLSQENADEMKLEEIGRRDDEIKEESEAVEAEGGKEPKQDSSMMVIAEQEASSGGAAAAAANYDRLTGDMLISVIESHRDALNDQKVLLAQQTDAINRLASAVEKQTKIISSLNENKLPIHN